MLAQVNQVDFKGQRFFIGIDVHKKNWSVTIRTKGIELQTFVMNPSPDELFQHLRRRYPGGSYHSVYEAGFCGFWIHRKLKDLGITNIVVNAADIPTKRKERENKRDRIDSRKLARELASGSLEAIWVPEAYQESLRSLSRLRHKQAMHRTRLKNRTKGHLHMNGISIPNRSELSPWSGRFIQWLRTLHFAYEPSQDYLNECLEELTDIKKQIAKSLRLLRRHSNSGEVKIIVHDLLMSIPGIGFITAMTFYAEIMDPRRFPSLDEMACYIGLVPFTVGSGDKEKNYGLTMRHNEYLRNLLIEAAWVAVRIDPALTLAYSLLVKRMSKQEAIIRIAKKLLNRIRCIWIKRQPYVTAVC